MFPICNKRWARNLTSRVQIPADPKFQLFLSFLRATLKTWQQIGKPFRQMAKPSADINKPHDRLNIGNPLVKYR
jgi:hypothetical protein